MFLYYGSLNKYYKYIICLKLIVLYDKIKKVRISDEG